jgi:Na+-translocating ferredoxin:NAD+ oxidoreductase RnfD subunit
MDWFLPAVIVVSGSFLNGKFARRLPMVGAWLAGFVLQAVIRHVLFGNRLLAALNPMTGVAFLLFTFYMMTDPATTPTTPRGQAAFAVTVAAAYGTLMALHIVFGLFFGLSLVCADRGALLGLRARAARRAEAKERIEVAFPAEV